MATSSTPAVPGEGSEAPRFLDLLAHDLRGPTSVVLGALDELQLEMAAVDPERTAHLFAIARRGLRRLQRIAEQLKRTSRISDSSLALCTEPSDLRGLIHRAADEARQLDVRRNVSVVLQLSAGPCIAAVDVEWLTLALSEMMLFALRSARREARVEVGCRGECREVSIFTDGGVGRRTFSGAIEAGASSAGLGLALARDIAVAHGGSLEGPVEPATGLEQAVLRLRVPGLDPGSL